MPQCPKCKEFIVSPRLVPSHRCPPIWYVHLCDFDKHDETHRTYAKTALVAAENAANLADYNMDDDRIATGGGCKAVVWDKDKKNPVYLEIDAYIETKYDAKQCEEPLPEWVPASLEEMLTP